MHARTVECGRRHFVHRPCALSMASNIVRDMRRILNRSYEGRCGGAGLWTRRLLIRGGRADAGGEAGRERALVTQSECNRLASPSHVQIAIHSVAASERLLGRLLLLRRASLPSSFPHINQGLSERAPRLSAEALELVPSSFRPSLELDRPACSRPLAPSF